MQCIGLAPCTIAPPSGVTLDGVLGTATMTPGMGVSVWTDGTNYFTNRGGILTTTNVTPLLVQSVLNDNATPPTTITYSVNVSPGDALVIEAMHSSSGAATASDNQGDTFTAENYQNIGGQFDLQQFVACGAKGGPTTITVTESFSLLAAYEFSNVATSSCVDDKNSAGTTNVASLGTGSATTTDPYDLIFVSGASRTEFANTITEANGYTGVISSGFFASALQYNSFYGLQAATGSLADTLSYSVSTGGFYAGILALKPSANSNAIVQGDLISAQANGSLGALHAGTAGYCLTSNGAGAAPTYQPCLQSSGVSGMTASQVPLAATATTITSSKAVAGSGSGLTTGPTSSTNGDCAEFNGTSGQIADNGSPCGSGTGGNYINIGSAVTWAGSGSLVGSFSGGQFAVSTTGTTITISSIPGTYLNLEVVVNGTTSASAQEDVEAQFNADSGNDYQYNDFYGSAINSTAQAANAHATSVAHVCAVGETGNYAGGGKFIIPQYAGTTFYKAVTGTCAAGQASTAYQGSYIYFDTWASTSAITSITLTLASGNWTVGDTISIYGTN